jgi:hypothetical protein
MTVFCVFNSVEGPSHIFEPVFFPAGDCAVESFIQKNLSFIKKPFMFRFRDIGSVEAAGNPGCGGIHLIADTEVWLSKWGGRARIRCCLRRWGQNVWATTWIVELKLPRG